MLWCNVVEDDVDYFGYVLYFDQWKVEVLFEYVVELRFDIGVDIELDVVVVIVWRGFDIEQYWNDDVEIVYDCCVGLFDFLLLVCGIEVIGLYLVVFV